MNEVQLSVCLITYNHVKYIRKAIDSVLMQKVNFPWELIIADDCSTDGTTEIIIEYQKNIPELIKLIIQENNVGPAQNWIDLITKPRSKYIAYVEGDDYWTDPYKLQKQVDFLEENQEYSFCFHNALKIYEDSKTKPRLFNSLDETGIHNFESLVNRKWFIATASIVFRNNINELPEWFHSLKTGDYALELLLAKNGPFYYIPDVMSVYRIHTNSVSNAFSEEKPFLYDSLIDVLTNAKEHYPLEKQVVFESRILQLKEVRMRIKRISDYPFLNLFQYKTYTRLIKKVFNIQRRIKD